MFDLYGKSFVFEGIMWFVVILFLSFIKIFFIIIFGKGFFCGNGFIFGFFIILILFGFLVGGIIKLLFIKKFFGILICGLLLRVFGFVIYFVMVEAAVVLGEIR